MSAFFARSIMLAALTVLTMANGALAQSSNVNADWVKLSWKEILESDRIVSGDQVDAAKQALWQKYSQELRNDESRATEFSDKKMQFDGSTMQYDYAVIGAKPPSGRSLFIALHGGGGAPKRLNDSQWDHMKRYYKDSVDEGVYLAARGIADTWNLHFLPHSFPLFDRLIENMILFEDVDPNRVYIMGFSAGGDGVYRLAPTMADRWAAASMSAGHPGNVNPMNLMNLPFLIQVGERDRAYKRHQEAAKFARKLIAFRERFPSGFTHQTFIHFNKPHNFSDRDPQGKPQTVIASPLKWLDEGDRETETANTNAVHWLKQYTRNPYPKHVVWDTKTRAKRHRVAPALSNDLNRARRHFWIRLSPTELEKGNEIEVKVDTTHNRIEIKRCGHSLTLLLNSHLCELSKPLDILIAGQTLTIQPQRRISTMAQTLLERGDPNAVYEAEVTLKRDKSKRWKIVSAD